MGINLSFNEIIKRKTMNIYQYVGLFVIALGLAFVFLGAKNLAFRNYDTTVLGCLNRLPGNEHIITAKDFIVGGNSVSIDNGSVSAKNFVIVKSGSWIEDGVLYAEGFVIPGKFDSRINPEQWAGSIEPVSGEKGAYGGSTPGKLHETINMDTKVTMTLRDYEKALASDWKIVNYFPNGTIYWRNIITEEYYYTGSLLPPNAIK